MPKVSLGSALQLGCRVLSAGLALAFCRSPVADAAEPAAPSYRVAKAIALGGGERWDLLAFDPSDKRVYIAHGDHVTVVDEAKGQVVGQIGTFPGGTHGIAISSKTNQGYTDDGKAGTAIAFDLKSLKPLKQIAAAPDADAIIYEPVTGHVYVIHGDSGSITVIDPDTNSAISTIDVGAKLEPGIADGAGGLFINGVANNEIIKVDVRTNKIAAHWAMPTCSKPHGLAVDPKARRLFATCANNVMVVVDADTGSNVATLPIGSSTDGAAFDPIRKLIFSSNGDGTLSVVREKDAQTFVVAATIKTSPGARTMTIDQATGRLFLVAADVAKIDPPTKAGDRPHIVYVPNSLKLLYLDPVR
jgi:YVTN family beta-propeller protein